MTPEPRMVAFCGFAGSGKNTAAEHVLYETQQTNQPVVRLAFADALKDAVSAIFQWDRRLLDGDTEQSRAWREEIDARWSARLGRTLTPRRVLQEIGTDVFRMHFHPDIWLTALEARLQENTLHVITDARFGNEIEWVRARQGVVIWVYRPCATLDTVLPVSRVCDAPGLHASMFTPLQTQTSLHTSEVSFLTEAAQQIHIVLINIGTRQALQQLTEHALHVANDPARWALPWNETTLYLQSTEENSAAYEWRYRLSGHTYSVYCNTRHEKVSDGFSRMVYDRQMLEERIHV